MVAPWPHANEGNHPPTGNVVFRPLPPFRSKPNKLSRLREMLFLLLFRKYGKKWIRKALACYATFFIFQESYATVMSPNSS